jgi:hypothetical protein
MDKPSTLIGSVDPARSRRFGATDAWTQSGWSDAETRAFLERPGYSPPFAKVLRVILITAMVIATAKAVWILVFHA